MLLARSYLTTKALVDSRVKLMALDLATSFGGKHLDVSRLLELWIAGRVELGVAATLGRTGYHLLP